MKTRITDAYSNTSCQDTKKVKGVTESKNQRQNGYVF